MHESTSPASAVDILLVDDREDGLVTLEALLHERGNYNLVKVRSGREAIGTLEKYDFAMILLDVQMPGMDGFETAEEIRKHPLFRSIPILFVTAIDKDDRYVYRGYEAGAVDYIFKPFDPVILLSKVAVFSDLHLKNRQIRAQAAKLAEQDVLEQRALMQSMELELLRRYRNLADSIPHILLRTSRTGLLEYHNELWTTFTGLKSKQSLGKGWNQAVYPKDFGKVQELWSRSVRNGESYEIDCRLRRYDGEFRWHWIKVVP